jgi:S-adenosylhomocysteine hydrolase
LQALFLKEAKQLYLNSSGKLTNLIKKEGAAICCFQQSFALNMSAGEGAFS